MSSAFPQGGSHNINSSNAFARPCPSPFAPVGPPVARPPKRSDDEIEFISSQPVKKRKIAGAKYQLKVTPPPAMPSPPPPRPSPQVHASDAHWRLPEQPVAGVMHGGAQDRGKDAEIAPERRVSTGMVGLPSDIPEIEAAVALRGVSLPSLESYRFDQVPGRPRPMASPPLSPKQLPPDVRSWTLDSTPAMKALGHFHSMPQPTAQPMPMDEDTVMLQAPMFTVNPGSGSLHGDYSPTSPAGVDRHMTNTSFTSDVSYASDYAASWGSSGTWAQAAVPHLCSDSSTRSSGQSSGLTSSSGGPADPFAYSTPDPWSPYPAVPSLAPAAHIDGPGQYAGFEPGVCTNDNADAFGRVQWHAVAW